MSDLTPEDWFTRIDAMFVGPTRPKWEDRLPRPSTISFDVNTQGASPVHVSRYWTPRNRYLDTLWSYYTGDPPMPQIAPEYQDEFRDVLRKARSNYAPMCIGAMLDRLEMQAVSTLADSDVDGDDLAAEIMDETGFSAVLNDLYAYTLALGEGYAMVVPGSSDAPRLSNGNPAPSIYAIDPRRCVGIPDPLNPSRLRAAVVREYDPITWVYNAYLFLPGQKWTLTYNKANTVWDIADSTPEEITGLDALGGIPIIRFDNLNGLGEYEPHLDLLDRINDVTLQRIIGFWYQALRQRAIKGDEDMEDQDEPESEPFDWDSLKAGPGAMWRFPKDFDIWESQQTDFSQFINGKRADVQEFAALTSTPLHLITPDAANGSAEGAGLMRESLTSKVRNRRTRFTPKLKLLWRMAFALAGADDRGKGMKLVWGPIEFRTLAEKASASAQAVGTLSLEDRNERIWEMPPDETRRNIQRMMADQLLSLPSVPNQNVSTPPSAVTDVGAD